MSANYLTELRKSLKNNPEINAVLKQDGIKRLLAANSSSSARKDGETTAEVIRDLKSEFETSVSVSTNLKIAINELLLDFNKLKNIQSGDASDEVKKTLGKYEEKIHRNTVLTDPEKTSLYNLTVSMGYNAQNYEDIVAKLQKGGRCFFCSVFNVIMTVVAAVVVVVAVTVLLPAFLAGAAITSTWLAGGVGLGAIAGGALAAHNQCWQLINYGQSPVITNEILWFDLAEC